jgi:hypothetical protein
MSESHPFASAAVGAAVILLLGFIVSSAAQSPPGCAQAQQEIAPRVASLIAGLDENETRRAYRAALALKIAEEYCRFGWTEDALALYDALRRSLDPNLNVGWLTDD